MHETIRFATDRREQLVDITERVAGVVAASGVTQGLVNVYAHGATAAIMVQENWDSSVPLDAVDLLGRLVPRGVWRHDAEDGNGDAHLKAGLIGPSETIPISDGRPGLSTWQGIFFCEFDGPRRERRVVCSSMPFR